MNASQATLIAALIAAVVGILGLTWSIISFVLTRRSTQKKDAREQWRARFEQAHALAMSTDSRESRTGILMIDSLSTEPWVTDEDRATTASVLNTLRGDQDSNRDIASKTRQDVLDRMTNQEAAAALAKIPPGTGGRFELWTDKDGHWRFNMKTNSGQVVMTSKPYSSKEACLAAIEEIRGQGGDASASALVPQK